MGKSIKLAFCICTQLLAFPLLASPIKGEAAHTLTSTSSQYLLLPNSTTQEWDIVPIDNLLNNSKLTLRAPQINVEIPTFSTEREEVGYLWSTEDQKKCKPTNTSSIPLENNSKYAVNFDGKHLIYFDYSLWAQLPYKNKTNNSQHPLSQFGQYYITHDNVGHLTEMSHCIMNNIMVNYVGMVEANHISMHNNHIILENKK